MLLLHVTSGHTHMRTYTHTCMYTEKINVCLGQVWELQWIHPVSGHKHRCPRWPRMWAWWERTELALCMGWEGGCARASGACSDFILGFFPSWFSFFSAAEQTPCLQGRCLMIQIQSLECLISCGQACFWQLTFLTARCWKTHTPQTINTMLKTQSWGKGRL